MSRWLVVGAVGAAAWMLGCSGADSPAIDSMGAATASAPDGASAGPLATGQSVVSDAGVDGDADADAGAAWTPPPVPFRCPAGGTWPNTDGGCVLSPPPEGSCAWLPITRAVCPDAGDQINSQLTGEYIGANKPWPSCSTFPTPTCTDGGDPVLIRQAELVTGGVVASPICAMMFEAVGAYYYVGSPDVPTLPDAEPSAAYSPGLAVKQAAMMCQNECDWEAGRSLAPQPAQYAPFPVSCAQAAGFEQCAFAAYSYGSIDAGDCATTYATQLP